MPDGSPYIDATVASVNIERNGSINQPISPRHAMALAYADAVFPCVVGGKEPAVPGGFHAATNDRAIIDAWWSRADYNIGVEPERAGWCVVDIDPKNGGDATWGQLAAEYGLAPTRTVRTPSGGLHLYFAGSLSCSAGKIGPGVDTRGHSGYVLVPPSLVDGKPYVEAEPTPAAAAPLPPWIVERVERAKVEPRQAPEGVELDLPFSIAEADRWLASQPRAVEGIASDLFFRQAARLKDWAISPATAVELLHRYNPSYDPDDIGNRVDSAGLRKRVNG
jgi:hypothetical protein